MEEFQEITIESERLILKRARYDLHYEEINKVVCDTQEHLEPWIPWAKTKPTPEVSFFPVSTFPILLILFFCVNVCSILVLI